MSEQRTVDDGNTQPNVSIKTLKKRAAQNKKRIRSISCMIVPNQRFGNTTNQRQILANGMRVDDSWKFALKQISRSRYYDSVRRMLPRQ